MDKEILWGTLGAFSFVLGIVLLVGHFGGFLDLSTCVIGTPFCVLILAISGYSFLKYLEYGNKRRK